MLRLITLLASAMLALTVAAQTANAETWPTKRFVFKNKSANSPLPDGVFDGYPDSHLIAIEAYENYLTEVAVRYEAMGFKAPKLPIIQNDSGDDAYLINVYDYSDGDGVARVDLMPDMSTRMRLDLSRNFTDDGVALPITFEHLSHELFHAVQRTYQRNYNDDMGHWIMEGQAQAVGMEMALDIDCIDENAGSAEGYRIGGRAYYRNLAEPNIDKKEDYRSSGFWRFLAEMRAASAMNEKDPIEYRDERCGVTRYRADYSVLHDLLSERFQGPASSNADLRWIDRALRQTTKLSLRRHYASFVGRVIDYVPDRMTRAPSIPVEQAKEDWRELLFGGCPHTINLTATAPIGQDVAKLDRIASRCFRVKVFGEGRADLTIHIRTETPEAISSLVISTAGGGQVAEPEIVEAPVGGGIMGRWKFRVDAGSVQTFLVSNVAIDPVSTNAQDVVIEASTSYWDTSLAEPRQQNSPGQTSPAGQETVRNQVKQPADNEVGTALASQSNRTSAGTQLSMSPDKPSCADWFAEKQCGPTTSIMLSLTPGAFGNMTVASGSGGGLAQVMGQFVGIAENGLFETDAALKKSMQEISDKQGSTVSIAIPFIDYGFTGSFSNAVIEVNGGAGWGTLQAIGPRDAQIGRGRLFPKSGRVNILEFTPYILRGTYAADLTDLTKVDLSAFGDDTPLPIHRSVSGSFIISAPWEGDPRVSSYVPDGTSTETMLQDLYQMFPAMRNFDLSELQEMIPDDVELPPAAGDLPSSEVGGFPVCDCRCDPNIDRTRACLKVCKPAILSCGQKVQLDKRIEQASYERDALVEDVDRMRRDFEDHMRASGMEEAHIAQVLTEFDAKPSAEDQRRMLMQVGMDVGSYGDDEVQRAAANPPKPETREEYIAKLEADPDLSDAQRERLIGLMDEAWAEMGGWPE
ncbi:MAG: hypothetical protein CMK07_03620 [Ponticaulis sp.]|nr:hypothetical protein [Ponticaulis sp.]